MAHDVLLHFERLTVVVNRDSARAPERSARKGLKAQALRGWLEGAPLDAGWLKMLPAFSKDSPRLKGLCLRASTAFSTIAPKGNITPALSVLVWSILPR
jgi:hypothetical protein